MEPYLFNLRDFQLLLTNPTVENVKTIKHFINIHTQTICSSGQENIVLTTLFTVIADINIR